MPTNESGVAPRWLVGAIQAVKLKLPVRRSAG